MLTPHPGLALAGDGIRIDLPVALMERAATTGWSAANQLLRGLRAGRAPAAYRAHAGPVSALRCCARERHSRESRVTHSIEMAEKVSDSGASTHRLGRAATHLPDAEPAIIDAALARSQRRPRGNWYAFAASSAMRANRPFGTSVAGVEIVAWRDEAGGLHVGPGTCPHLGADLTTGTVDCGALICPWHGLRLSGEREFGWKPLPGYDDGVLAWVRLDRIGGEEPCRSR